MMMEASPKNHFAFLESVRILCAVVLGRCIKTVMRNALQSYFIHEADIKVNTGLLGREGRIKRRFSAGRNIIVKKF